MPEPVCTADDLKAALAGRDALFAFLRRKLAWNVDEGDTFTYDDPQASGRASARADVSQILPFSSGDPFVIFLVEFKEKFLRGDLREILRGVRGRIRDEAAYKTADLDELIFVCTVPNGLRFVHFEERTNRQPKLRLFGFDTDTVGETYTLRTVNLPLLKLTTNLLGEADWAACRKNWQEAWNVERVTREFFKDYKRVFETVRDTHISGVTGEKQMFTQRLFNRLMFIHFLSKKGWLEFNGRSDYLFALREAAQKNHENLFHDRLYWAFFSGLGVQAGAGNNAKTHSIDELVQIRGSVPYLNGGLFEMADADDVRGAVTVDNAAFDLIFDELFGCYNFTVSESTPDDQDVAVDPEMLGKVFEELVTGRHESGSYYTPRPVVQFMCRESLKGYLAPCGPGTEKLVDFHDAQEITNHETVLAALKSVKIVDPACGSGAYLLGMLQELMALRLAVFNAKRLDDASAYKRKLEIIQNNLYGVDLDPFAVNTARLRLWLSLVVEDTRNALAPDANGNLPEVALPNLDFKIEEGDSISCVDPSGGVQPDMFFEALVQQLCDDKNNFGKSKSENGEVYTASEKTSIREDIETAQVKLLEWAYPSLKNLSEQEKRARFDWTVRFVEVFDRKRNAKRGTGFDIVVMNPPYLAANRVPPEKREAYRLMIDGLEPIYKFRNDLYIYFFYRALQMLKKSGVLCAITSNSYMTNQTKEFLRVTLLENTLCWLVPLSKEVFEASVYSSVCMLSKQKPEDQTMVKYLNLQSENVTAIANTSQYKNELLEIPQVEYQRTFSHLLFEPTQANRTLFETLLSARDVVNVNGKRFAPLEIVAPALDTGIDSGNVRSKLFYRELPESQILPKMLQGKQIVKYGTWWNNPSARFYYVDADYKANRDALGIGRGGRQSAKGEYWGFRGPIQNHHVTERLLMRQTEDEPFVGYIRQGDERIYTDNTIHTLLLTKRGLELKLSYLYLLAVLNSNTLRQIYNSITQEEGRAQAQVKTGRVNRLPILIPEPQQQKELERLVENIQNIISNNILPLSGKNQQAVEAEEAEINARVAALYGL